MHGDLFFFNDRINPDRVFQPEFQPQIRAWLTDDKTTQMQKEAFLQALLDFDDDCGGFYRYRSRFLAAEYLALCPECRQGDAIVDDLLKLSYAYFRVEKADWGTPPEAYVRSARETLAKTDLGRVVERLEWLIRTTESRGVMAHAARELLRIQPGNRCGMVAIAFDELIYGSMCGHDTQSESFRIRVFLSLTHIPIQSDDLARGLSRVLMLISDSEVDEQYRMLRDFIQVFPSHPLLVYKALLLTARIYDSEAYFYDERIRLQPDIDQLWQTIYQNDPTGITLLIQAASWKQNYLLDIIRILCQLCPEHKMTASLVISTLAIISAGDEQHYLLDKMGEIGHHHPTVRLALLKIFYTSEELEIKYISAINLRKIDPTQSEIKLWIISAIREVITSGLETFLAESLYCPYQWTLYARSLVFEDIRPIAIDVWSQAIQHSYRHCSPDLIKALGFVPEMAILHWLGKLQPTMGEDPDYYINGLLGFFKNFANHPQVIAATENIVQTAIDHENLYEAAKILLQSDAKHPLAREILRKMLIARTEHLADRRGENCLFFSIANFLIEKNIHLQWVRQKLLHRALLPHPHYEMEILQIARHLSKIDRGDCTRLLSTATQFTKAKTEAIRRLAQQASDNDNFRLQNCFPIEPYINWVEHSSHAELANIVTSLKPELTHQSAELHSTYHAIAWKCAQQLPYKTFREAWKTPIVNPQI
jgi:hypothetical protein